MEYGKQTKMQTLNMKNFIFYPTYTVTPQMFKLMSVGGPDHLICGGYGIGKTVSILLFIHLYYPLHKFIY